MATVGSVLESLTVTSRLDNQISAGADAGTASLNKLTAAEEKAAASAQTLGNATEQTDEKIKRATRGQEARTRKLDEQVRLTAAVAAAERNYQAAVADANREVDRGLSRADAAERIRRAGIVRTREIERAQVAAAKTAQEFGAAETAAGAAVERTGAASAGAATKAAGLATGLTAAGQAAATLAEQQRAVNAAMAATPDGPRSTRPDAPISAGDTAAAGVVASYTAALGQQSAGLGSALSASRAYSAGLEELNRLEHANEISSRAAEVAAADLTRAHLAASAPLSAMASGVSALTSSLAAQAQAAERAAGYQTRLNAALGVVLPRPEPIREAVREADLPALDTASRAADVAAYGAELNRLRAKFDPLFAASRRYEASLDEIAAAERIGALSAQQAAAATERLTAAFADANRPVDAQAEAARRLAAELDGLRDKYDPAVAASQRYGAGLAEIARLQDAGLLGARQAEAAIEGVTQAYVATGAPLRAMADNADAATLRLVAQAQAAERAAEVQGKLNAALKVPMPVQAAPQTSGATPTLDAEGRASVAAYGAEIDRLREKYDPLYAAAKRYSAALDEISAAERIGALTTAQSAAEVEKLRAQYVNADGTFRESAIGVDIYSRAQGDLRAQAALLAPQLNDVFTTLASGGGVFQVVAQQSGQILPIFGGLRGTLTALVTYIGGPFVAGFAAAGLAIAGLAAAGESSARSLNTLGQRLRATRDDYQTLARDVQDAAKQSALTSAISTSDAREVGRTIASSPNFTGGKAELVALTAVARDLAAVLGEEVPASAARLAEGFTSPTAAAQSLANAGFKVLTEEVRRNIERLENQGRTAEASALLLGKVGAAVKGAAEPFTEFEKGTRAVIQQLTGLEQSGTDFAKSFGKSMADAFGQSLQTFAQDIEALKKLFTDTTEFIKSRSPGAIGRGVRELAANEAATASTAASGGLSGPSPRISERASSLIYAEAERQGIRRELADLATRIAQQESGGRQFNSSGRLIEGSYLPKLGESAQGMFQVLPSTGRGMGFSLEQLQSETGNIQAGLAYIKQLDKQYGGDLNKVTAGFNTGPGNVNRFVADPDRNLPGETRDYLRNVRGVDQSALRGGAGTAAGQTVINSATVQAPQLTVVNGANSNQNRQALNESDKLLANIGILTRSRQELEDKRDKLSAALENPDISTKQVNEYVEGIKAINVQLNNSLTPSQEFIQGLRDQSATAGLVTDAERARLEVRQQIIEAERRGAEFSPEQRAEAEALAVNRQVESIVSGSNNIMRARAELESQRGLLAEKLNDPNADKNSSAYQQTAESYRLIGVELNNLLTPAEKYLQSQRDALAAGSALTEGDRVLLGVRQEIIQLEREGAQFSPAQRREAEALALEKQSAGYRQLVAGIQDQVKSQEGLSAAYGEGYAAVARVNAEQQAYQEAIRLFPRNSEQQKAALAGLTVEYERLAQASARAQIAQQQRENNDELAFIERQTQLIGVSAEVRERELAVFRARQELQRKQPGLSAEETAAYLQTVDALAAGQARFEAMSASYEEIRGIGVRAFEQIGDAAISALLDGEKGAIDFGRVFKSVIADMLREILKLAIINPIMNELFKTDRPTIGGLFGALAGGGAAAYGALSGGQQSYLTNRALGQMGGAYGPATASDVSSGIGLTDAAGGAATLYKGVDLVTGGALGKFVQPAVDGIKSAFGFGASITSSAAISAAGTLSSTIGTAASGIATNTALNAAGAGVYGVATAESFISAAASTAAGAEAAAAAALATAEASQAASTVIGVSTSTIASALPYIGVAVSAITALAQGNYKGAGLIVGGAITGAAIGSLFFGVGAGVGAAVGAAIGGLIDMFSNAPPKNPYETTPVINEGGRLRVGDSVSQILDPTAARNSSQAFVNVLNDYMDKVQIKIDNPEGRVFGVGQNITGFEQVSNPLDAFKQLRFASNQRDNNYGIIADGGLRGLEFENIQQLNDKLIEFSRFADVLNVIGIRLGNVAPGLKDIDVRDVQGDSDVQRALNSGAGIAGKRFTDRDALEAEVNRIASFVQGTIPALVGATLDTFSQFELEVAKLRDTYEAAKAQAASYGLSIEDLAATQNKLTAELYDQAARGIAQNRTLLAARLATAQGDDQTAALMQFDVGAERQREQLAQEITDVYGDAYRNNVDFANRMRSLEEVLAAERANIVQRYGEQAVAAEREAADKRAAIEARRLEVVAGYNESLARLYERGAVARGGANDNLPAAIRQSDRDNAAEREAFARAAQEAFGGAYFATQQWAEQVALLEGTLADERIAIVKRFADEARAAEQAAAEARRANEQGLGDLLFGVVNRNLNASAELFDRPDLAQLAALRQFDRDAQTQRDDFNKRIGAVFGDISGTVEYLELATNLENTLANERLLIIKRFADQAKDAEGKSAADRAAALESARGSLAQTITSIADYASGLRVSGKSPLSAQDQLAAAESRFNAISGAALAGDYRSLTELTGAADTLLGAARTVEGSGTGYAAIFERVTGVLEKVPTIPLDAATNSAMLEATREQTVALEAALARLTAEVQALRMEQQQAAARPRAAA